jgi:hypothetical protein
MPDYQQKLAQVAKLLLEKTKTGEIKWETTSQERTFQTSLSDYSVMIAEEFEQGPDEYYRVLRIFNEAGRM